MNTLWPPLHKNQLIHEYFSKQIKQKYIYLDHAAATPLHSQVFSAMLPYYFDVYGNPASSLHKMGETAHYAVEEARIRISELLGLSDCSLLFVSSATEGNNFILKGLAAKNKSMRKVFLYSATEHSSIINTIKYLDNKGLITAKKIPVDYHGQIVISEYEKLLTNEVYCVAIMSANNETGIIQHNIERLYSMAKQNNSLFHMDAVQSCARGDFSGETYSFDTAVISSGKMYGPKGVAAVIIRNQNTIISLDPLLHGGGQENNLRSSTLNVPGIIGFAEAVALQKTDFFARTKYLLELENEFIENLKGLSNIEFIQANQLKLPGIFMFYFPNKNSVKLLEKVKQVCLSTGSACKSGSNLANAVLIEMGYDIAIASGGIRVSFGISNTIDEIVRSTNLLAEANSNFANY